jgi:hypothetical protein
MISILDIRNLRGENRFRLRKALSVMSEKSLDNSILVTGDVVVDWNIAEENHRPPREWTSSKVAGIWRAPGGAVLLAALMRAASKEERNSTGISSEVFGPNIVMDEVEPEDNRYHHAYHLLREFNSDSGQAKWRVARFLGFDPRDPSDLERTPASEPSDPAVILLNDANLGFRDQRSEWPKAIRGSGSGAMIVLKQSAPIVQGLLWEHLLEEHAGRLVVITSIEDLRRSEVQISRQISWERTAQDVFWEVVHNPRINRLIRCAHIVISLDTAGAILLSSLPSGGLKGELLFDPLHMEGEWERKWPGMMYGFTTCLSTALMDAFLESPRSPDLRAGIQAGVRGMRVLLQQGFGSTKIRDPGAQLALPLDAIAKSFFRGAELLSYAEIQNPVRNLLTEYGAGSHRVTPGYWTILEDRYTRELGRLAQQVVVEGADNVLKEVPIGKFGALTTVDRREIESLRGIRTLIGEYLDRPQEQPLSIAVFGPPGSGKSFAVKQISRSAAAGEIRSITFNLSQFDRPEALLDAFHQVRDIALSGAVPLIFWDEFDTPYGGQALGWLKYFLAPMQDGKFQEGQISHPIGKAIFVFAGGTCHHMQAFGGDLGESDRRAAKLPDFISRLKGFIDILGPNPLEDVDDPYFIIRRAIILRALFEKHTPQIISSEDDGRQVRIDKGILRAFLETDQFKHGVRSMETLLTMSTLAGASAYDRSCLPPEDQLHLHVEGKDFLARVQQLDLEGEVLEELSKAAHEVFCEGLVEQGYSYGPRTDEVKRRHRALVPYEDLDEDLKESNRENVRHIPNKLAEAGYVMLPARSNEPPFDFPGPELERLARMEHARWSEALRREGWRHGGVTDDGRREHAALLPWENLPEDEREKDRDLVRSIPKILARAGYAIILKHREP